MLHCKLRIKQGASCIGKFNRSSAHRGKKGVAEQLRAETAEGPEAVAAELSGLPGHEPFLEVVPERASYWRWAQDSGLRRRSARSVTAIHVVWLTMPHNYIYHTATAFQPETPAIRAAHRWKQDAAGEPVNGGIPL